MGEPSLTCYDIGCWRDLLELSTKDVAVPKKLLPEIEELEVDR